MPIFSIVIPHKNCPELLERCINSVPDRNDIEIILVDDNSNDKLLFRNTMAAIQRSNLIVIESDKGGWAGGSRNLGLDMAKGEWVIFLDADDYFLPGVFDLFITFSSSDNDIIYFRHQSVYSDTLEPCERFPYRNQAIQNYLCQPNDRNRNLLVLGDVVPWGKMIRRSLIEDNHVRYDEIPCCEDVMFITRCAANAVKIEASESIVYCLTYRCSSLTMNYSKEKDWVGFTVSLQRNKMLESLNVNFPRIRLLSFIVQAYRRYGFKEAIRYYKEVCKFKQSIFTGLFMSANEFTHKVRHIFVKDSYNG